MVTIILIVLTSLVSLLCFTERLNASKMLFHAYSVWHRKEWYRMLTYGFVHGSWGHLFFNMLTLFFFGRVVSSISSWPLAIRQALFCMWSFM